MTDEHNPEFGRRKMSPEDEAAYREALEGLGLPGCFLDEIAVEEDEVADTSLPRYMDHFRDPAREAARNAAKLRHPASGGPRPTSEKPLKLVQEDKEE